MLHVYAIFSTVKRTGPSDMGLHGIGGAPVTLVRCRRLVAAVSEAPAPSEPPDLHDVLDHEQVVEELLARFPVLPVRYGSVATEEQICADMERRHGEYLRLLRRITGKREFGITAEWPAPEETLAAPATTAGPGQRYLEQRLAEQHTLTSRARLVQESGQALLAPLTALSDDYQLAVLPPPLVGLAATFLVDETDSGAFTESFGRLRDAWKDVTLLCSGPWPAYSFVES